MGESLGLGVGVGVGVGWGETTGKVSGSVTATSGVARVTGFFAAAGVTRLVERATVRAAGATATFTGTAEACGVGETLGDDASMLRTM
jgi:hypothetical protein